MGLRLWPWVLGLRRGSVAVGLRHGPSWLFVWFVVVGLGSAGVGHGSADVGLWQWVLGLRRGSVAVGLWRGSVAVVSDMGLSSLLMCSGFLVVNRGNYLLPP
jgi:hypothetical protein